MNERIDITDFEPRVGNRLFKKAGVFVCKSPNIFFSLKSGFTSAVHKHCDDNSFILWYQGEYLICDTGSYNYDYESPIRRFVASTLGHSGIFPLGFCEGEPHGDYYSTRVKAKPMKLLSNDNTDFTVESGLIIDDGYSDISRTIERKALSLTIIDEYSNGKPLTMRQRFILHPNAVVDMVLSEGNCVVFVDNNSAQCSITTPRIPETQYILSDGYYSEDFGKYETCKVFDVIKGEMHKGAIHTTITLGKGNSHA